MNFQELTKAIAEQSVLAKSLSAAPVDDDKKIAAAAADGAAAGGDTGTVDSDANADNEDDEDKDKDGDAGGEGGGDLVKSFSLQLENGEVVEAQDATELIKSLQADIDTEKQGRAADTEQFLKAFGDTIGIVSDLAESVKSANEKVADAHAQIVELKKQNETLAKSLAAFGNEGRGRRSVDVTVHSKPPVNGEADKDVELSRPELLAKSLAAMKAGRISGAEASKVEAALNMNVKPNKEIMSRILGA
jgi:hypothetical protein